MTPILGSLASPAGSKSPTLSPLTISFQDFGLASPSDEHWGIFRPQLGDSHHLPTTVSPCDTWDDGGISQPAFDDIPFEGEAPGVPGHWDESVNSAPQMSPYGSTLLQAGYTNSEPTQTRHRHTNSAPNVLTVETTSLYTSDLITRPSREGSRSPTVQRRHSPYPGPSAIPSSPSSPFLAVPRPTLGKRSTDPSPHSGTTTQLSRAINNPVASEYGRGHRRAISDPAPGPCIGEPNGHPAPMMNEASQPQPLIESAHVNPNVGGRQTNTKGSEGEYKVTVASPKTVNASRKRRTKPGKFSCNICPATFTANHNLKSEWIFWLSLG